MAYKALSLAGLVVVLGTSGVAIAQSSAPRADTASQEMPKVSSTGKHMPEVGQSKSAGVTSLDRKEEARMRQESSICKGC